MENKQNELLDYLWGTLPRSKGSAWNYGQLCEAWGVNKRRARLLLHRLSAWDNGDPFVLIRSSGGGFYLTDDREVIAAYRREVTARAVHTFENLKKVRRIEGQDANQITIDL